QLEAADTYSDFRRALERRDIDAVHIGTPDHWHAIPAVLACRAGKHVYVEKPLTMEAADRMYGITMPEPGVSRLVGVRFGDVVEEELVEAA
ncbi:MAG: Gfo/Idh/MocA family oxidoreductase, partial [Rubricoccaceae bacterium]|nr:Gfo/Idh/MocA family oxidoreductase [Rubricoccaceae bacterium]